MANIISDVKQEALWEGYCYRLSIRKAALFAGVAERTAEMWYRRFKRVMPVKCVCGKRLEHRGWCHYRFRRSEKRIAFMKEWNGSCGVELCERLIRWPGAPEYGRVRNRVMNSPRRGVLPDLEPVRKVDLGEKYNETGMALLDWYLAGCPA